MDNKRIAWKKYRSTKIDFSMYNKRWKALLLLSLTVGFVALFLNCATVFSQTTNRFSAIPTIVFGVISMLALCALGIAVLIRHYHQAKQR